MRRRLAILFLVLLVLVTACGTTPGSRHGRVLLLSLDGADSITLHRLYGEGKLEAGGFARFFREGEVAEGMRPIDPAMTAVNHVALATGHPAAETGIVGNDFLLPGAPLGPTVSGFAADIGTETLWEAARRQGLRVAVSAWPGADDRNERRRGDWGMTYSGKAYPEAFATRLRDQGLVRPGPPDKDAGLGIWLEQDERFSAFFTDALLAMAGFGEWDLLMGYSPVLDEAGHHLLMADPRQPGWSPERRDELDRARTRVWQAVDRDLALLLAAVDLRTTTVLVVSDHGMAPTHTVLEPSLLLRDWGYAGQAEAVGQGGLCFVYLRPAGPGALEDLRSRFLAWKVDGEAPIARVLTRAEAAEIGLDHPNSGDLILQARAGYHFRSPDDPSAPAPASPSVKSLGKHGYPSADPAMQAIHLALGRGVKPGRRGTLRNTEVAGEVASWLGIEPPRRHAS